MTSNLERIFPGKNWF